jgi:single-strand DNA-binding protein
MAPDLRVQEKTHDQSRYPRRPHRPRSRNPHHHRWDQHHQPSVVTDRPARKDGKTYKDENGYTAKDSEFHRITCFNGLGQNVAKFCSKGQLVTVEGRIHYTQWEDQDGTKRYGCEIIADKVDFLTKGRGTSGESAPDIDED